MEKSPEKYPHLFSPMTMGTLQLKNRIVMAPMATGFFDQGRVTPQAKNFYLARARRGRPDNALSAIHEGAEVGGRI